MPQWSSGKSKVFEVLSGQDLSLAVAWRHFSFVVGRKKGLAEYNSRSCQQLPQWSSGKDKVFEVYVGSVPASGWSPFSFMVGRKKGLGRVKKS